MRPPGWIRSVRRLKAEGQASAGSWRDRLAVLFALVTVVFLCSTFILSKGTQFLMPGPLTSAHGAIEKCGTCHTKSGSGKLSWIHGLVAGDPLADSKACLTCHKMPETAFNAHGASAEVLKQSTERLTKIAELSPAPKSARAQSTAFPTKDVMARGLYCATCHQEHQGVNFNLSKISNEQCRSCHVVKFNSFDGQHPKFDNYPFERRTRIIYDHVGHFGKHYPEVAKKEPARRIPAACSTCHNSHDDKRIMALSPFEETCSACHLDQITGKARVSGPKGIAFMSLPGLDLPSLKKKNASIGEWPDSSEASLTPFMKVMISRTERGRAVVKTVDSLNLQDLTDASDDQIKAVADLVWEIKTLFYSLISGKASDVLGDLKIGGGEKLSANLVSDLTASIPRDVVTSAQQQWLPNLAKEIANGPGASDAAVDGQSAAIKEPVVPGEKDATATQSPDETSQSDAPEKAAKGDQPAAAGEEANKAKFDPPACVLRLLGQCLMFKERKVEADAAQSVGAAAQADAANAKPDAGKDRPSSRERPGAMRAGLKGVGPAAEPEGAAGKADAADAKTESGNKTPSVEPKPRGKPAEQSDDLLFPTAEELREINAQSKGKAAPASAPSAESAPKAERGGTSGAAADSPPSPQTEARPAAGVESDVDPESWAENGGWYRQDFGIYYRPTGHKDKFIYAWLILTGPQASKNATSPASAVFEFLTGKEAQGSCTKCHSVDEIPGKGRLINFAQPSVAGKQGRFTRFVHEPHFGIMDNRGCLTCHSLEKDRPYLKSYEQSNPKAFASNFGAIKKDLCQTCHTKSMARQDCLLCHRYHVNGVITPAMNTKLPTQ